MAQVTIQINGREYGIACGNGQEGHILRLAALLNEKAALLTRGNNHINENQLLAMIGLLLADELTDIKNGIAPQAQVQTVEKVVEKVVEVPVEKVVEKVVESKKSLKWLKNCLNLLIFKQLMEKLLLKLKK